MGRRYRNPNPHLDIQYVTTWSARIPRKRSKKQRTVNGRGQPLKQEPLDPEDEFIADTDPEEKPLSEATLDDVMEGYEDPEPSADPTEDLVTISDVLDTIEVKSEKDYIKAYSDNLKDTRAEYREAGLSWIFSRNTMMEIGMRCGIDYYIDPHYKRVIFADTDLNDIILDTASFLYERYMVGEYEDLTPEVAIDLVVWEYTHGTTTDTDYDLEKKYLMDDLGIEEEYSDKGNPIGEYRIFNDAFNKVWKEYYTIYGAGASIPSLDRDVELEMGIAKDKRRKKNVRAKTMRKLDKIYSDPSYDTAWESPEERLRVKDAWFAEDNGYSLYEWNDLQSIEPFT